MVPDHTFCIHGIKKLCSVVICWTLSSSDEETHGQNKQLVASSALVFGLSSSSSNSSCSSSSASASCIASLPSTEDIWIMITKNKLFYNKAHIPKHTWIILCNSRQPHKRINEKCQRTKLALEISTGDFIADTTGFKSDAFAANEALFVATRGTTTRGTYALCVSLCFLLSLCWSNEAVLWKILLLNEYWKKTKVRYKVKVKSVY